MLLLKFIILLKVSTDIYLIQVRELEGLITLNCMRMMKNSNNVVQLKIKILYINKTIQYQMTSKRTSLQFFRKFSTVERIVMEKSMLIKTDAKLAARLLTITITSI